eukprot:TRINITY_DN1506_c1_g1_i2.p1 TRINITY_DN1506_c1_g1~~TRINITY_DN1506_c1_g1_i2.p1  ORF type:complete len:259 (-),score=45.79 TRINITY_DN1506_c1_g1_i2:486-1262(-)
MYSTLFTRLICSSNAAMCIASFDYPTTLMIKNIPTRAKVQEVVQAINELGYKGSFNFLYLPDRLMTANCKTRALNFGYAFVNFKAPEVSKEFMETIAAAGLSLRSSNKILYACHARVQGLEELIACSQNSRGAARLVEDERTGKLIALPGEFCNEKAEEEKEEEEEEAATTASSTSSRRSSFSCSGGSAASATRRKQDVVFKIAPTITRTMPPAVQGDVRPMYAGTSCNPHSSLGSPMYIPVDARYYADVDGGVCVAL